MQLEDINMSSAPDRSSRRSRSSSRSTSSSSSGDDDEDTRTGRGGLSAPPPHAAIRTPSPELPPPKQLWPSCPTTKPTTALTALIDHAAPKLAQVWGMRYGTCNMRYGVWGIYVLVISSPCDIYTYALYICISLLPSSSSTPNFYRWLQLRLPNRLLCW